MIAARALTRRIPPVPDALALYAALSDHGRRRDTALFESRNGPSLILDAAALRIQCRGQEVHGEALSQGGLDLIEMLAAALPDRVAERQAEMLTLRFPPPEGVDAEQRLLSPSPFDALRALLAITNESPDEPFALACLGVLAFDHVDMFESLPPSASDPTGFPDFVFWVPESLVVLEQGLAPRLVCTAFGEAERAYFSASERLAAFAERCAKPAALSIPAPAAPREAQADLDDEAYAEVVGRMKAHIAAGDVYQIVPSRTFSARCADPLAAFAAARAGDPSPYMFFVAGADHHLFGASPESAVRIFREAGETAVEVKPIAGTRRRGADADEDDRMEADLRLDSKEVAEHMMLVDLARNDVARVSIPGTRRVHALMNVERYARVMHLVSSVRGKLAAGRDAFHALQSCLNVGTLSGAPKLKAVELLRRAEATRRGPYGGAIGWVNGEGMMDTGVVIRSALVKDEVAYVRAGAGVVHDSDPLREADETRRKASAMLAALAAGEAAA